MTLDACGHCIQQPLSSFPNVIVCHRCVLSNGKWHYFLFPLHAIYFDHCVCLEWMLNDVMHAMTLFKSLTTHQKTWHTRALSALSCNLCYTFMYIMMGIALVTANACHILLSVIHVWCVRFLIPRPQLAQIHLFDIITHAFFSSNIAQNTK